MKSPVIPTVRVPLGPGGVGVGGTGVGVDGTGVAVGGAAVGVAAGPQADSTKPGNRDIARIKAIFETSLLNIILVPS